MRGPSHRGEGTHKWWPSYPGSSADVKGNITSSLVGVAILSLPKAMRKAKRKERGAEERERQKGERQAEEHRSWIPNHGHERNAQRAVQIVIGAL